MSIKLSGYIIRREKECDYRETENMTREAFWNEYCPGCSEHFLIHNMRSHKDYVPELSYVLEKDGEVIGSVMYSKCVLRSEEGEEKEILSMGPICVKPEYQRQGGSRILLEYTFAKAKEMGYTVIVNFGNPANYIKRGYMSCKKLNVYIEDDIYPTALLVKELIPNVLLGKKWQYIPSDIDACCADTKAIEEFDRAFSPKEKTWKPSQEEFYIYSHSSIR